MKNLSKTGFLSSLLSLLSLLSLFSLPAMANDGPYRLADINGTAAGTREILPLPATVNPTALTSFGSRFLFVAQVQAGKQSFPQLFLSDGTPAGTRQISAINQPRDLLFDDRPVQVGGTVFFRLNDPTPDRSSELWRTDGTLEGTRRASTLLSVDDVYVFRGALYLTAILPDFSGRGLYRMTPGGTPVELAQVATPLQVLPTTYPPPRFTPVGDRLLFVGTDRLGSELWITDGAPAGTHPLLDLQPGPGSSNPDSLVPAGSRAFFNADDGTQGRELWESDGTPEGTQRVKDIAPGGLSALPYYYFPGGIAVSNGFLFFNADDGTTGVEPWALPLAP